MALMHFFLGAYSPILHASGRWTVTMGAIAWLWGQSAAFGNRPVQDRTLTRYLFQSPGSTRLVTVAEDGRFAVWDTRNWAALTKGQLPTNWAPDCIWSPPGSCLYFRDRTGRWVLYSTIKKRIERRLPDTGSNNVRLYQASHDGRFLLCWEWKDTQATITIRDSRAFRLKDQWPADGPGYWPPGEQSVCFPWKKAVYQVPWPRRGRPPRRIAPPGYQAAWSPDGSRLALTNDWDVSLSAGTRRKWLTKGVVPGYGAYVGWSQDGSLVYVWGTTANSPGSPDVARTIMLTLLASDGKVIGRWEDGHLPQTDLPGGKLLLRGGSQHSVQIIDRATDAVVKTLSFGR